MNTPTHAELCQAMALVSKVLATQLAMTQLLGKIVLPLDATLSDTEKADAVSALDGLQALVPHLQACAATMEGYRSN